MASTDNLGGVIPRQQLSGLDAISKYTNGQMGQRVQMTHKFTVIPRPSNDVARHQRAGQVYMSGRGFARASSDSLNGLFKKETIP